MMKRQFFLLVATFILGASFSLKPKKKLQKPTVKKTLRNVPNPFVGAVTSTTSSGRGFEKFVDNIFKEADTNQDGTVDFNEVYELVLKLYVHLNRQAPIPPPTRSKIFELFTLYDISQNQRLDREEFRGLARLFVRRAFWRLLAHKCVTVVGAPLLAECVVTTLATTTSSPLPEVVSWLQECVAPIVIPTKYHEKWLPIVTSIHFWRTVFLVTFVATFGNMVIRIVNFLLDLNVREIATENPNKTFSKK